MAEENISPRQLDMILEIVGPHMDARIDERVDAQIRLILPVMVKDEVKAQVDGTITIALLKHESKISEMIERIKEDINDKVAHRLDKLEDRLDKADEDFKDKMSCIFTEFVGDLTKTWGIRCALFLVCVGSVVGSIYYKDRVETAEYRSKLDGFMGDMTTTGGPALRQHLADADKKKGAIDQTANDTKNDVTAIKTDVNYMKRWMEKHD